MSDETKANLELALSAHFADEFPGAYSSQWILMVYGVHAENNDGYYLREWPDGQPVHVTSGLIDYARQRHAIFADDSTRDADED